MKFSILHSNRVFGLLCLSILISNNIFSQNLNLNLAVGGSNYQGDLTNSYIAALRPAVSAGFHFNLFNNVRLRTNLSFLQIGAHDNNSGVSQNRNLDFQSNILEAAELLEIDLLNSEDNSLVPYVFGGASIYHFDPTTTIRESDRIHFANAGINSINVGEKIHLHDIGTEGQLFNNANSNRIYNLTQYNAQLGAGLRFQLSEAISIAYELSFRKLNTDYLDDVSANNYISGFEWQVQIKDAISKNNLNRANLLRQGEALSWRKVDKNGNPIALPTGNPNFPRGNPTMKDAYFSNQIRLNITIVDLFTGLFSRRGGGGSSSSGGKWGGKESYNSKHKSLYSPNNPFGTGQLRCPRVY